MGFNKPTPTTRRPRSPRPPGGDALSLLGQVRALGQQLGVGAGALYAALSRGLPGTDLAPMLTALPATLDPGWRQRARDPLTYLVHLARNVVRARELEAALAALPPEPEAPPPVGECATPPDADAPAPPPPGCAADRWASFLTALLARLVSGPYAADLRADALGGRRRGGVATRPGQRLRGAVPGGECEAGEHHRRDVAGGGVRAGEGERASWQVGMLAAGAGSI